MVTRRAQVIVRVVGAALGLGVALAATELDLPIVDDIGRRPHVAGSGFILVVVIAVVALVSLVAAVRGGRARRRRSPGPATPVDVDPRGRRAR